MKPGIKSSRREGDMRGCATGVAGLEGKMTTAPPWHRISRRSAGALVAALLLLPGGFATDRAAAQAAGATVRLLVDYGDGTSKIISDLPWSKGNTVLDVMNAAKSHPHGISFSFTGSGASAFMTKIDDVQNEGGGAGRRNWQLWVNTIYADRSFAAIEVQALDTVFWRFTTAQGK